MKKTYNSPLTKVVDIRMNHMIADSQLSIGGNSTNAGWAKEDNSWDIWGDDEE